MTQHHILLCTAILFTPPFSHLLSCSLVVYKDCQVFLTPPPLPPSIPPLNSSMLSLSVSQSQQFRQFQQFQQFLQFWLFGLFACHIQYCFTQPHNHSHLFAVLHTNIVFCSLINYTLFLIHVDSSEHLVDLWLLLSVMSFISNTAYY